MLCGLVACGDTPASLVDGSLQKDNAIIGGTLADDADYPAVGALLIKGTHPWYGDVAAAICTGTLIAPDVFLVASHCVDTELIIGPGATATYYVSFTRDVSDFGSASMTLPALTTEVKKALQHPDYDPNGFNTFEGGLGDFHDVALTFLKSAVTGRTPATVLTPANAQAIAMNDAVRIAGYGIRDADYDPYNPQPDESGIMYLASTIIHEVGDSEMQIGDVAPTPQKCHGDSGGPTFRTFDDGALPAERVIGVTSHAYDDTDCHRGGVDTRVDAYRAWIESEMIKACTNGTRTSCANAGALALPEIPEDPIEPGDPGSTAGATSRRKVTPAKDEGCNASGASGVAALLVAVWLRQRRR